MSRSIEEWVLFKKMQLWIIPLEEELPRAKLKD